jgi:hypothetical protein
MMKICFIADNRVRLNWGCRATSIALKRIVASVPNVEITSTIYGDLTADPSVRRAGRRRYCFFGPRKDIQFATPIASESVENFLSLKDRIPYLNDWYEKIAAADAVVINGEGTFIISTIGRYDLSIYLMLARLAMDMGKKVYFLNMMFSYPPDRSITDNVRMRESLRILRRADAVSVRDPMSLEIINKLDPSIDAKYIPDALFSLQSEIEKQGLPANANAVIPFPEWDEYWNDFDFSEPYVAVSGSSLIPSLPEGAVFSFSSLVRKLKETCRVLLVPTCGGDDFLKDVAKETRTPILSAFAPIISGATVLANARAFVSGRYHPSIMASLGGTPCVFMKSNSHKTLSLQPILEYKNPREYSVIPSDDETEKIAGDVSRIMSGGGELRRKIKSRARELAIRAQTLKDVLC